MTTTLIPVDTTPNANGRLYSREVLEEAVKKMPAELYGTIGYPDDPSKPIAPEEAAFKVSGCSVTATGLTGEVLVLDSAAGKKLAAMMQEGSIVFRPSGVGEVDDKGAVYNYELVAFNAIWEADDAFGA